MKYEETVHVAFVGNPNCGKTTLFNAITGARLKVANWPGVTVEKIEGEAEYEDVHMTLVDTPGIYSLTSYTIEEKVTRGCVMDDDIEVIVNVVDASSLERNLYLTLQLLELGKPVVLALNMMDVVEERGMEIDLHRLPELLGDIPVVPVSAAKRKGLDILLHAVIHHYEEGSKGDVFHYSEEIEEKLTELTRMMRANYPTHSSARWHAIKLLEGDEEVRTDHPIEVGHIVDRSYEKEIIQAKYGFIESIIKEILFYKKKSNKHGIFVLDKDTTDRADAILTHPVWGVPVFLCIMALVFFLTFAIGDWLKGYFETFLEVFSEKAGGLLSAVHAADWLNSLIVDGIIAGVGGILTFIPNIAILFLALAILEDSGYMARVAYVMDGIMGKAGLSGKAFLPMILGFGCTVPAIMASRALETERDRKKTMIITPFMSCSARLPVYVLFSGMFFGKYAHIAAFSMYVIGMFCAILVARILYLSEKRQGGEGSESLLIELPEYKRPNGRTIRIYVWNKLKDYLSKAGTTIFIASIFIWAVLNFGPSGMIADPAESFGAILGRWLEPVMRPAGLGMWQIIVSLIAGISAKEVVVSSFSVLFGVGNSEAAASMDLVVENLKRIDPAFGPLNAYCMMLFVLLYVPCAAAMATIRKESGSTAFMAKLALFQILFAWTAATLVFQIGSLLIG